MCAAILDANSPRSPPSTSHFAQLLPANYIQPIRVTFGKTQTQDKDIPSFANVPTSASSSGSPLVEVPKLVSKRTTLVPDSNDAKIRFTKLSVPITLHELVRNTL